ncbi:MAG: S8 family serine peptidase [Pseudonocardiaceae bacterium]
MTYEPQRRYRSPIVGDLRLPPDDAVREEAVSPVDPDEKVPMLVELNVRYPGGLLAVREAFSELWSQYASRAGGSWPTDQAAGPEQQLIPGLAFVAPKLYQCVLSRRDLRDLVEDDQQRAAQNGLPTTVFRVWPDYEIEPQIDRSSATVKADAAWRSFAADGKKIVWAVIDSGIDAEHPHFCELELATEGRGDNLPNGLSSGLHRDFSYLVNPDNPLQPAAPIAPAAAAAADAPGLAVIPDTRAALVDDSGHGTHVAGIIAGCTPQDGHPRVADSQEAEDGGFVQRERHSTLSGMARACELVSLKVMRRSHQGTWVTSSAAVIRALTYLRIEVNVDPGLLRVHGVNMSLGCAWRPDQYAAGQSPLCQAVNQLVGAGVVVVVSAGNYGARIAASDGANISAIMGSVTEPAHAQDCIAVGSTHREAPHVFGISWTSGKGPTLDGRMKPDVVAPGEWIASAATGEVRAKAGLDATPEEVAAADPAGKRDLLLTYAELSGTSMAAPHVSGVIAAFLSARPEFIGRPQQVKSLLTGSATDLGRERYAQGAGLADLMRMLTNV